MTGTGVAGISDNCNRSTNGVSVMSLGIHQSVGENVECTWDCQQTNAEITNKLWKMPGMYKIFMLRTAGIIRDSPAVHKQSIYLNGQCDAWIIVHYRF